MITYLWYIHAGVSAPISWYNVFPILGKCSLAVSTSQELIYADKSLYFCRNKTLLLLFKADDARSNKLVEAMIKRNEQTSFQDLQDFRLGGLGKKLRLNQSEWLNRYKSCKNLNQSVPSICLFSTNQNGQIGPNPAKWDERDRSPTTRPSKRHMVLTASSRTILTCLQTSPISGSPQATRITKHAG